MVLLGTTINALAIIVGSIIGLKLTKIKEKVKVTVMEVIALSVVVMGISMGLKSENFLIVIGSLVIGAIIGERFDLELKLDSLGRWIEKKLGAKEEGTIVKGFVTTTIIYVFGALGIVGALDSGLRNDHSLLYTKSLLDGFSAIIFTSTLGIGVIFSSIPVFLYQGTIALLATVIMTLVPQTIMDMYIVEMTATGGVMILAIGLNILGITKVRVANLLPSLLVVAVIIVILEKIPY